MKKLLVVSLLVIQLTAVAMEEVKKQKRAEVQKTIKTRFDRFFNKSKFPFNESDQNDYLLVKSIGFFMCRDLAYAIDDKIFIANMLRGVCTNLNQRENVDMLANTLIPNLEKNKKNAHRLAEVLGIEITDKYTHLLFKARIIHILKSRKMFR